jgi:bifunctional non-homologous end joining protein LigD
VTESTILDASGREVELKRPDKVLYPDDGLRKQDLAGYYRDVAEYMLPHLDGRALTLHRYPDGLAGEGFVQQQAEEHFPDWLERSELPRRGGGRVEHVLCSSAAGLVFLADQAVLEVHAWLSRADKPERPDRLVWDLDPAGDDFDEVRRAARDLRALLDELGLAARVMLTGSRGAHVVVPLRRRWDFDAARDVADRASRELARRHPDRYTLEQRKDRRKGRLFLDTLRNNYGQTAVAPYSTRARPGAPVATPLDWDELGRSRMGPRRYTVRNIFRRLSRTGDPWRDVDEAPQSLSDARQALDGLERDRSGD